jgi:hypothetical protein
VAASFHVKTIAGLTLPIPLPPPGPCVGVFPGSFSQESTKSDNDKISRLECRDSFLIT